MTALIIHVTVFALSLSLVLAAGVLCCGWRQWSPRG